jgi:hypothetical protein
MEDERDRAVVERDAVDDLGELTDTGIYEGDLEARPPGSDQPDRPPAQGIEFLESTDLRRGETSNPDEAAEEGLVYVAPTDPPVVGTEDDGDPRIAAGFGDTADSEPFDADHHGTALPPDDEMTARVREALLADAATSGYADSLALDSEGGVVRIEGVVADLEDEENVLAVVAQVTGVVDVDNALVVEGLG